jgi:hypothetical protein
MASLLFVVLFSPKEKSETWRNKRMDGPNIFFYKQTKHEICQQLPHVNAE